MDLGALIDILNKISVPPLLGIAAVVLWRSYQECLSAKEDLARRILALEERQAPK